MTLAEVKNFLRDNVRKDFEDYFGMKDSDWIDRATNNWFDDHDNYDGRWKIITDRLGSPGRVLDMAAGCGTFVLFGLHNGYDIWGIEPSDWKRTYFKQKVEASRYPKEFLRRIVGGVGEALPFPDQSFDLVTTYQTLEHVQDVGRCLQEMLRVLKLGGSLFIQAPAYDCFFEGHYRLPMLPMMNRRFAAAYLRFLGRPVAGLDSLQYVTEKKIIRLLKETDSPLRIEPSRRYFRQKRLRKIERLLPNPFRFPAVVQALNFAFESKIWFSRLTRIAREEGNIDLWATKEA